jgi:UPF0755 protein
VKLARIALVLVAAALVVAAIGAWTFKTWLETPLPLDEPAIVAIPKGQPLAATAKELAAKGYLEHPRFLALYARFTGADQRVRAGEYEVQPGTTPAGLLEQFESGKVVQYSVTLIEGRTFAEYRAALAKSEELIQTLVGHSDAAVMAALGEPDQHPEGLFFPDTYLFPRGTSDIEILRQARERMRERLATAWGQRSPDLPLQTPYEALILASIVEKETGLASERRRIAGVFTERLRIGMRLQTDPTIIYGLGESFDGNLRRADLERDGPYNTYTRTGLPPTPIANPGADSLMAAVNPDERGELFFVATGLGDGSHAFSRDHGEHEAAVRQYLQRLRQQNRGK